ncbi:MAG TPA: A24 family peptidase [Limnobacter sp.]|uniref:prepilin peptidase n=1 Tax=Limnobacter sp. TaxID=2003368 RepID=UPI002ED8E8C4
MIDWSALSPIQWWTLSGLLGLCVGSFLNVVAYRLPIMMERAWDREMAEIQGREPENHPRLNLLWPPSHCTACKKALKPWHNIPVLSFVFLKARCGHCDARIGWRYPVVELGCAALFVGLAALHPAGWTALALMGFAATLLVLALIDLDTYLLPDDLTLPLLWAGLLFNLIGGVLPLNQAVMGAMLGYGLLWVVYHGFKLATGKEGMGYGDFKLLAAVGAWLGAMSVFTVLLFASVFGIVFGLAIQKLRGKRNHEAFPFGPCLVAGALAWMAGLNLLDWF